MAEEEGGELDKFTRKTRKCKLSPQVLIKNEIRARIKQVRCILKKAEVDRTVEEVNTLTSSPEVVKAVHKREKIQHAQKQRVLEIEDDPDVLRDKCLQLASAIRASNKVVIYTGAGISTAASIPDYRGPNGVWTLLKQGKELTAQDLCDAEPTYTHMSITRLYREGHVKHVVSQNCDGLHIRSGLSRNILSEVHGNMFIELCKQCKPHREHIRLFDVTEKTGVRKHATGRRCHKCSGQLQDTIVHFGEKGGLKSPYRWKEAVKAANNCDVILCLGSSLKLLKKYSCLWCMDRRVQNRPSLYIVNLQWTPKDENATLKLNGRCDSVMREIMSHLGYDAPIYKRDMDPIFGLSTPLRKRENKTTSKKILEIPQGYVKPAPVKRKPLRCTVPESKDSKAPYSAMKLLLGHQHVQSQDVALPLDSISPLLLNPSSLALQMLHSPELKAEPIDFHLFPTQAMQDPAACLRFLSGQGVHSENNHIPHVIPSLHVPVQFQSAVLAASVLAGNDLKSGPAPPGSTDLPRRSSIPPDIPRLPGTVILDHCYCKQIDCRGQCRNSPEKSVASSSSGVNMSGRVQEQALDLSSLSRREHPLDLSAQSRLGHCTTDMLVEATQLALAKPAQGEAPCESKPPGLVLVADVPQTVWPPMNTFSDLQRYCMTGLPAALQISPPLFQPFQPAMQFRGSSSNTTLPPKQPSIFPDLQHSPESSSRNPLPSQPSISCSYMPRPPVPKLESDTSGHCGVSSAVKIEARTATGPPGGPDQSSPRAGPPLTGSGTAAAKVCGVVKKTDALVVKTEEDAPVVKAESASASKPEVEGDGAGTSDRNSVTSVTSVTCAPRTKKRASSASIPGWFGKGLAIKKRRRF